LFCVYHHDRYPAGNDAMGPAASLAGRHIGEDFAGKDGWRMYHGSVVPGFPQHPHRGFETITFVRRGLIDHSDSLGATARFGHGDVQWLTAGSGIVHSEMFPLLRRDGENPVELFQIWLNLPRASKMATPRFTMFWKNQIPVIERDGARATLIAGRIGDVAAPAPPPDSWAADSSHDVGIFQIALGTAGKFTLPPAAPGVARTIYFFRGDSLTVEGAAIAGNHSVSVRGDAPIRLENPGRADSELLVLQGRPIGEPITQYGPFVMTSSDEIRQAFADYQRTQFGGWPWPSDDPVHPREAGRYAKHADGHVEAGPL
jgi:redox-sensitive bicupin YhaK (pirin superfamily)